MTQEIETALDVLRAKTRREFADELEFDDSGIGVVVRHPPSNNSVRAVADPESQTDAWQEAVQVVMVEIWPDV